MDCTPCPCIQARLLLLYCLCRFCLPRALPAAGAAGEGQPGDEEYEDEDGSEGSVIEEEEEVVEQLPPGVVDPHDVQEVRPKGPLCSFGSAAMHRAT